MLVTAKPSKKFYDTFGEEVANGLVDWFNQVDATYRADLRELNELNFARFDAKLEQRIAQVEAKLDAQPAELIKWMFIFWAGTVIPVLGMVALLSR